MRSNVAASRHYEDLFNSEMSSLDKVAAAAGTVVAPSTTSTKLVPDSAGDPKAVLAGVNLAAGLKPISPSKWIGDAFDTLANKVTSRPAMALLGAGLGLGGKYLYDNYVAVPDMKESDIRAVAEAERYMRDAKMRELGIAGASLAAGLVLPEVARMGSRAVPFVNSDFDADDIRKMMRD